MLVSRVSSYIPTVEIVPPQQMLNNLSRIAFPAIALVGASMISQATATPFGDCMDSCDRTIREGQGLVRLACYAACWFIT